MIKRQVQQAGRQAGAWFAASVLNCSGLPIAPPRVLRHEIQRW